MAGSDDTYKKIIKSASIFGAVQVVTLLISVIRTKALAILIGPAGYGIMSLLTSTTELVRNATGFALDTSGVKRISEAKGNDSAVAANSLILLNLSFLTGLAGMAVVIILSRYLSIWTFGNTSQTITIALVAIIVLFKQVTAAYSAILQGLSQLNYLAKVNLYGNVAGLLITLPLFFFWGIDAIILSLILSSLAGLVISWMFYKKIKIRKPDIGFVRSIKEGKEVLFFGGLLSINSFLPLLANYLIILFVNHYGGIGDVGLLNVGLIVINTYVGIVFTAMSTEYYPRLSSFHSDTSKVNEAVNQQAIISILIILPIIVLFLGFSPLLIRILFSHQFDGAIPLLIWGILAMFFKAVSWSMGYVIIAKADSKVFVKTSLLFNILYLCLSCGGYYYDGFHGLGIGFMIYFTIHLIVIYIIVRKRYAITLTGSLYRILGIGIAVCLASYFLYELKTTLLKHVAFTLLFGAATLFSFFEIDKRIHLKSIFIKFKNRGK